MLKKLNIRELSEIVSNDQAFISLYFSSPAALVEFEKWKSTTAGLLKDNPDEYKSFNENIKMVESYLEKNPLKKGALIIFSCWLGDFFKAEPTDLEFPTLFVVDSSPYIKPLAEMEDDYEDYAVVLTDNKSTRVFVVSAGKEVDEEKIKGNVKNHVKVGGWSQQRYERRRDKELKLYGREVIEQLTELEKENGFDRLLLLGSAETMNQIVSDLPANLKEKLVGTESIDLARGDNYIEKEIFELLAEAEEKEEADLFRKIKTAYLRGTGAAVGAADVFTAAKIGRVEEALILKDEKAPGSSCRDCGEIALAKTDKCPACGSDSVFEVDLIEEIVEHLAKTSAQAEFTDREFPLLKEHKVIANLRY